jgi:hypothetical protein
MAESFGKTTKDFDLRVEGLMASSSAGLERSYFRRVMAVGGTNNFSFAAVSIVGNHFLARRNHVPEAVWLTKDSDVICPSRKGPIHPNKVIGVD